MLSRPISVHHIGALANWHIGTILACAKLARILLGKKYASLMRMRRILI
jgi:hypothetical protein